MKRGGVVHTLLFTFCVAMGCSVLVSAAVVTPWRAFGPGKRSSSMTNTRSPVSMWGSMLGLSMATSGGQTPLTENSNTPTRRTALALLTTSVT